MTVRLPWSLGRTDESACRADDAEPDYRFTLANERTFLAWIRTSLAFVAGGVAIRQVAPDVGSSVRGLSLAVIAIALGGILACASLRRWFRNTLAIRKGLPLPPTGVPFVVTVGLVAVACLALLVAVY